MTPEYSDLAAIGHDMELRKRRDVIHVRIHVGAQDHWHGTSRVPGGDA